MAEKDKHKKVEIIPPTKAKEKDLPPPASEARVGHEHELADEETALKDQETAADGERRKAGDPMGRAKEVEDELAQGERDKEHEKHMTARAKAAGAEDLVKVTMLTDTSPPTVGKFNTARELELTKLESRKTYSLPANVAAVLVDANKAVLHE